MRGDTAAALEVLQGILLALYRLDEDDRGGELLQGAPELTSWKWLPRTPSANARRRRR